jgi:4-amino-4-deoxy-L-arabinose transferase
MLMAHYAVQAAERGFRSLRINAWINIGVGVVGVIAAFVVSPWGPMKHPVWATIEIYKAFCAGMAFFVWALVGWYSLRNTEKNWLLSALCPLGLTLLIGFAIPNRVMEAKQPQFLVEMNRETLQNSRYVIADNVGLAAGLAWELKRSDITLFNFGGELKYGLDYPDAKGKLIRESDFSEWLAAHRQDGITSLVVLLGKNEDVSDLGLPHPTSIYVQGRIALLEYAPLP